MKHILLTTIAAVLLVGCGTTQQSAPSPEAKPEPTTAKAPDISIHDAAMGSFTSPFGNIEAVKQHLATGADVNAKTKSGNTPLDKTINFNRTEIADLLRKHGGKTGDELK